MYDQAKVSALAIQLADRISKIRMGILDTSIYGSSTIELQKQSLRREASELVHGVQSNWQRQAVTDKLHDVEGQLQTAAAMGLIGDKDLQRYLGMIDDIYASLDQEN